MDHWSPYSRPCPDFLFGISTTTTVSEHDVDETSVATAEFELFLGSLARKSFARGAAVDGTWEIELEPSDVPDWTVEIRKMSPGEDDAGA